MSEHSGHTDSRSGELLRRIAQIVAFSEGTTPEVRVGDVGKLSSLEETFPDGVPPSLSVMYSESDPVSLTVPLAGEDLDFIPLQDVADVHTEESLEPALVPFARAGKTLLCVRPPGGAAAQDGGVVAVSRVGTEWEEEPAGKSLDAFLAVLVEILDRLTAKSATAADTAGETQATALLGVEIPPEKLVEIEAVVEEIDPEYADFWMSLLS